MWWGFTAIAVQHGGGGGVHQQHCRSQHHNIDNNLQRHQQQQQPQSDNRTKSWWKQASFSSCSPFKNKYIIGGGGSYKNNVVYQNSKQIKSVYDIKSCNQDQHHFKMRGSTAGITDGLRGTSKAHYAVLTVLDMMLSALLISPLVVSYWRGTWCLMDYYVYPERPDYSSYVSLGIGLSVILIFTLFQGPLKNHLHPNKHRLSYYFFSRLYTAFFGFACVNSWRGAWIFLDVYTGDSPDAVLATTLSSVALLTCLRTLRNISAPPFAIVTDRSEGYFEVPTMFRISVSTNNDYSFFFVFYL